MDEVLKELGMWEKIFIVVVIMLGENFIVCLSVRVVVVCVQVSMGLLCYFFLIQWEFIEMVVVVMYDLEFFDDLINDCFLMVVE